MYLGAQGWYDEFNTYPLTREGWMFSSSTWDRLRRPAPVSTVAVMLAAIVIHKKVYESSPLAAEQLR